MDEGSVCILGCCVGKGVGCVMVLSVVDGVIFMLCWEDASGLLDHFSNCFREYFIFLFEIFFRYDGGLSGVLYLLYGGYVVQVKSVDAFCGFLLFFL